MKLTLLTLLPFALCLLGMMSPLNAEPGVTGSFKGDGKEGNLAHVSACKGEQFSDKETVVVVLTEQDHSKSKNPKFDASFEKFGSALILTINSEGRIIGCQVAHSAHKGKKSPFNAIGKIKTSDFKWADGVVQGKVSTGGEVDFFGQKWSVELTFQAKVQ
jgi:hypothetical protein